jgi:hypothetical protein
MKTAKTVNQNHSTQEQRRGRKDLLWEKTLMWNEMKSIYSDEWLLITDFVLDQSGHLISGVVARHSVDKDDVYRLPALDKPSAFKYTGESTFPGGWRAHAEHHHV